MAEGTTLAIVAVMEIRRSKGAPRLARDAGQELGSVTSTPGYTRRLSLALSFIKFCLRPDRPGQAIFNERSASGRAILSDGGEVHPFESPGRAGLAH